MKRRLRELAIINPSRPGIELDKDDKVSFIPMSDVNESGRWQTRQERRLKEVRTGYTCFTEGDVLFAKITPCMENGKGCHATELTNGIGFGTTEFHVLRARTGNNPRFIYHLSNDRAFRLRAQARMIGSAGQQRVPTSFLEDFEVEYFPEESQEKIADVLTVADDAIARTEALIAKYRRIRTGLMQDLLTKGIDENGRVRSEETHEFKDSPLGRIPVEWEVKSIGECAFSSAFGPRFPAARYARYGAIALLRTTDMDDQGNIHLNTMPHVNLEAEKYQHHLLEIDDFLVTRSGTIGIAAVFEGHSIPVLPGAFLIRFRLDVECLSPSFLKVYINSQQGRQRLKRKAAGGVQKNISGSMLLALNIPIPPPREQEMIGHRVTSLDGTIASETRHLNKLRRLKTALMQDLLTGRVSVEPLLRETAADPPATAYA